MSVLSLYCSDDGVQCDGKKWTNDAFLPHSVPHIAGTSLAQPLDSTCNITRGLAKPQVGRKSEWHGKFP